MFGSRRVPVPRTPGQTLRVVGVALFLGLLTVAGRRSYAEKQASPGGTSPLAIAEKFLRAAYPSMWEQATRVSASTDDWVNLAPPWRSGMYTVRVERAARPGGIFGGLATTSTPCLEPEEIELLNKPFLAGPLPFVNGCEIPLRSSPEVLWEGLFYFPRAGSQLKGLRVQGTLSRVRDKNFAMMRRLAANPSWTESQITEALKQAGARYGPTERKAFLSSLDLSGIRPFLLTANVKSVSFGLGGIRATRREAPLPILLWTVRCAGRIQGSLRPVCGLEFEPFEGSLVSLGCGQERVPSRH